MMNNKISVALYVRNEATDIDGWISWYFALGVDKIFIFDDQSTDGTFEIIQSAAEIFNIEYFRVDREKIPNFQLRHKSTMQFASELAQQQGFRWIGFFDADEYLHIKDDSLSQFLGRLDNFDGVAINWCVYGSSGRVVKPCLAVPDAFRSHSTKDMNENALVKSFIRPNKFQCEHYGGPHRFFSIEEDKYADPNGNPVIWDGPLNKNVDWNNAKVMHYMNRSLEHYVERIKRRLNADLSDSRVYFDILERNDIYDSSIERFLDKTYENIGRIQERFIQNITKNISSTYNVDLNRKSICVEKIQLKTANNQSLYYNKKTKRVVFASDDFPEKEILIKLDTYIIDGNFKFLHISFPQHEKIFFLDVEGDLRTSLALTYRVEFGEKENQIYLISPKNNTYLDAENCFEQLEGILVIKSGNLSPKLTGEFFISSSIKLKQKLKEDLSLTQFYDLIRLDPDGGAYYFANLLNMMSEDDKILFRKSFSGITDKLI